MTEWSCQEHDNIYTVQIHDMAEFADTGTVEIPASSFLLDRALPFLGHAVILPFRWTFMRALPAIFLGVFAALRTVFGYLWSILCILAASITFPLRVLFVWPAMWTLHFIYQVEAIFETLQ